MKNAQNASNIDVKRLNRNRIFRYINKCGQISKPEISNALGLSGPTVLMITKELIEKGVIKEDGEFESTGGRKAKVLTAVHNIRYAVGLDITLNHISLVLTDLSRNVLMHIRVSKPFAYTRDYIESVAKQVSDFIESAKIDKTKLLGIGISLPGIIDVKENRIVKSHILNVENINFNDLSSYIPIRYCFINDANAAAIAEIVNMETASYTIYLSLSNSVGGAIISYQQGTYNKEYENWINRNIYVGDNSRSGEIGHMILVPGGEQCYCGKYGCFDAYCSAKKLARLTDGKLETFFERIEEGDTTFLKVWDEYLEHLAIQIINLRMLMDCNIIIGGYVGSFIGPYMNTLKEKAKRYNTFNESSEYIVACKYKVEASALGAALLLIESYIDSI